MSFRRSALTRTLWPESCIEMPLTHYLGMFRRHCRICAERRSRSWSAPDRGHGRRLAVLPHDLDGDTHGLAARRGDQELGLGGDTGSAAGAAADPVPAED